MKTQKHTPGPWTQGVLSYRIETNHNPDGSHDLITEVASANPLDAALIAAAPEMLEALEALVERVSCLNGDAKAACFKQMDVAYKAIAKAKGGAK